MAIFHINKLKKGQSLVEVMVAMFVLMIVFVSMATLIVQALNLVTVSRTRTEVTALAQRAMSDATIQVKTTCSAAPPTYPHLFDTTSLNPNPAKYKKLEEKVENITSADKPTTGGVTIPSTFYKVTVTVVWRDKSMTSDSTYVLTQLVAQQ